MANTVVVTNLLDGTRRRIIHVSILGDGSGQLTNYVIYNYSADTNKPPGSTVDQLWVEYVNYSLDNFSNTLFFDGATPFQFWSCANNGTTHGEGVDFRGFGGVKNHATTPNGNLIMSSANLAASEHMTLVISLRKGGQ